MGRASWLLATVLVVACTKTDNGPPATWFGEVGTLLRQNCAGCHRDGGIAPFSLYDPTDAQEHMNAMLAAIDSGEMPPFSAIDAPDCTPRHAWANDPRLSSDELQLLHDWVDQGGPLGTMRTLPDTPSTTLDNPTLSLQPTQPFSTAGDRDQFVCFLFDPQLTHAQWITGSQVYPTAPEFVHHANVGLVSPGDTAAALAQVGGIGVPSLGCDTPPGNPYQSWLPGNPALVLPDSIGIPVVPGMLIAVQVHYHPAGGVAVDATSLDLRLSDTAPAWTYELGVYGNATGPPHLLPDPDDPPSGPIFQIPAGKPDHVETMAMQHPATLAGELRVWSVTPHMHMLGTHERATLQHPSGDTECLVDSSWNFDWQRTYQYAGALEELPVFDPLSTVTVDCHWNNTFDNPMMTRLLTDANAVAPYDVNLGLTTTDEMCLADFGIVSPTN